MIEKDNQLENDEKLMSLEDILEDDKIKGLDNENNNEINKKVLKTNSSPGFFVKVLAEGINQIVVLAMALVGLILLDLILGVVGFYIVEREPMFLIVYVIMNIIYGPICKSLKMNKTIGEKVLFK